MADQPRRYRLKPDPTLNPNEVSVGLSWSVNDQGQVLSVFSTPALDEDAFWNIPSIAKDAGIQLSRGNYRIVVDIDGLVEELMLPAGTSEADRCALLKAFTPVLQEDAVKFSDMLARFPTDRQIIAAARMAAADVLQDLLKKNKPGDPLVLPEIESGFFRVLARQPKDINTEITLIKTEDLRKWSPEEDLHRPRRFGDYGFYAIKSVEDGNPQICVGFVDHKDSSYSGVFNEKLARRFVLAINLVEPDVVTNLVSSSRA